jgi:DNA-binding NarL/FixJ family response regulator
MGVVAPKLRIFVADDHAVVRDGLRLLVNSQHDMEVSGDAGDSTTLVRSAKVCSPDVAVIDVAIPVEGGAKAAEQLKRDCPEVKVLALSAHEEREYVDEMLAAGARGYVGKRAPAAELLQAIRRVAIGETYIDPAIYRVGPKVPESERKERGTTHLSVREEGVLRLVARGYAMKDIASSLNLSVRTVETYRARAMEKATLRSRADVVRFAAECGWLTRGVTPTEACPGDPRLTRGRP